MSEFEDKLGAILGDPNAMSQIMALAQSLGGGPSAAEPSPAPPPPPAASASSAAFVPSADLAGLLGGLDPQTLQAGMQLLSELSSKDDERTALLLAIKPFLKEDRSAKIDRAVQLARLSRVLRVAFQLFRGRGGEHV